MKPKYIIQIGLAAVLIYAGISALLYPLDWISFIPEWLGKLGLSLQSLLLVHSIAEILLGLWLLINKQLRLAAILVFLDLLAIVVFNGFSKAVLSITFRDFGLLAMALYLIIEPKANV